MPPLEIYRTFNTPLNIPMNMPNFVSLIPQPIISPRNINNTVLHLGSTPWGTWRKIYCQMSSGPVYQYGAQSQRTWGRNSGTTIRISHSRRTGHKQERACFNGRAGIQFSSEPESTDSVSAETRLPNTHVFPWCSPLPVLACSTNFSVIFLPCDLPEVTTDISVPWLGAWWDAWRKDLWEHLKRHTIALRNTDVLFFSFHSFLTPFSVLIFFEFYSLVLFYHLWVFLLPNPIPPPSLRLSVFVWLWKKKWNVIRFLMANLCPSKDEDVSPSQFSICARKLQSFDPLRCSYTLEVLQ